MRLPVQDRDEAVVKMSCKVGRELGRETPEPGKLERLRVLLRMQTCTALDHTGPVTGCLVNCLRLQYIASIRVHTRSLIFPF